MKIKDRVTETDEQTLVISRLLNAPRERVWKAWTGPDRVMRWWGPKIFRCPSCQIDFHVGGRYLFCMQSDTGPETWQKGIWSTGVYTEIVPMEKIVCTDCFADEQGHIVPATYYGMGSDFPLEMLIIVTFKALNDSQTQMTLHHVGLPPAMKEECRTGWNESFDKLAESLKADFLGENPGRA